MITLDQTRFVERLHFFNGQRLTATDLQGIEAFNREMRWLHNRSLHQPGIGNGFAVRGNKGDREVWIGPGYALDALGREIVLTQPMSRQVPPVANDDDGKPVAFDLAVRYPDDADLEEAETRAGICDTHGVVRLREEPIFCWVRLRRNGQGQLLVQDAKQGKAIQDGMLITLARVEVFNCQLHGFVSIAERRDARPSCLPYLACGMVKPEPWEVVMQTEGRLILKADVDTKEAGFITTPCYSAAILGDRIYAPDYVVEVRTQYQQLLIDHVYVHEPRHDGFTAFIVVDIDYFSWGDEYLVRASPDPANATGAPETTDTAEATVSTEEIGTTDYDGALLAWISKNWKLQWLGVEG